MTMLHTHPAARVAPDCVFIVGGNRPTMARYRVVTHLVTADTLGGIFADIVADGAAYGLLVAPNTGCRALYRVTSAPRSHKWGTVVDVTVYAIGTVANWDGAIMASVGPMLRRGCLRVD